MAQVANPHKKFQWSIFLFGMNPFLAQKVTTVDRENDIIEHGEGNHLIKTGGMVKFGQLVVEKIQSGSLPDVAFNIWSKLVNDEITGAGTVPEVYKKAVQVVLLGSDNITPIKTWNYTGVWPCKINGTELDRVSSDNTIQSIEFCIDREIVF